MSKQGVYLKTFNKQFEDFFNEINEIIPNHVDLMSARTSLFTLKKFNPKMLIGIWYDYIWIPYRESIEIGDISYFIDKNYGADVQLMEESKKVMEGIDNIREPIKSMSKENQDCCMKYIQNISKLSAAYKES